MKKSLEIHLVKIQKAGNAAIIPYIMAGDGGLEKLDNQLHLLEDSNVSAIEVGIPFSDPVADGPIIQAAGLRALKAGTTLKKIVTILQKSDVTVPLVIMSYFNPILNYGLDTFVKDLEKTNVKGLIIPDLPYEHRSYLKPILDQTDIALISFVSLTSPNERILEITKESEGFIYAVTVNGTTGVRQDFSKDLDTHFKQLSSLTKVPVLAGFGVSEITHVEKFAANCNGTIIGSKVVTLLHQKKEAELKAFLTLAAAVPLGY